MALVFLTDNDILTSIREVFLDHMTDEDQNIIDKAEASAISKMKSKLSGRFDVDAIFTATDEDRDPLILEYCVAIFLYRLHGRINPRKVPSKVKEQYDEAMEWLKGVMMGKENPALPILPDDELGSNSARYGGSQIPKDNFY